jgi:hypothetical protein
MNPSVTIRIWEGCTVRHVVTIGPTGSASIGAAGGAGNSTKVDIELDPWSGLVVDNRAQHPSPVSILGQVDR